jgi:ATP-dependent Clp protease ATP-binding subunit ClpA
MRLPRPLLDIRTISRLLKGAEAEAQRDGSERPGPEHLVLSALALPDGVAVRALQRHAIGPDDVRAAVVAAHQEALLSVGVDADPDPDLPPAPAPSGPYRLSDPGRQVFHRAVALAKQGRPMPLSGGHVLAAACELRHGTFARALGALGLDRHDLATAALAESAPI